MIRLPHWQTALHARAQQLLGVPFEYGQTDCPMVCLMMADAMSGRHEAELHRGKWSDRKTGLIYVKKTGNSLEAVLRRLGGQDVEKGFQQAGDFILTITADGWVRGHVCLGMTCISADRDNGISLYSVGAILTLPDHSHLVLRIA
jgi:hypothetical protein